MNKGEIEYAERIAFNLLDKCLEVSGLVEKNTSYYYELQGCIQDAVHCGIQMAINGKIDIKDDNVIKEVFNE